MLTEQFKGYNSNLANISENLIILNETINLKTSKLKSAELLINNTNPILSTVYYGTADTEKLEGARDFTAFSLTYNDKFFLITAGHCVEMDGERIPETSDSSQMIKVILLLQS